MNAWPFGDLKLFGYDLVVIDVPAPFDLYSNAGNDKSPAAHYKLMTWPQIKALPVGQLCRADTLVLNWCCAPSMNIAIRIMEEDWGIKYVSRMTWHKVTKNKKTRWGPGYRVRTGDETCLVGLVGNPDHKPLLSHFDGLARESGRKPDEFYAMVEKRCPRLNFRADVFSRFDREGWDCWGDQSGLFNDENYVHRVRQAEASNAGVLSEASELPLWAGTALPGVPGSVGGELPREASDKNPGRKARLLRAKPTSIGRQVAGSPRGGKGAKSSTSASRDDGVERPRPIKTSRPRPRPKIQGP